MPPIARATAPLTRAQITQEMRTLLGGTRVAVELDPQQFDLSITRAVRKFRRHIFGTKTIAQYGVVGLQRFALPENGFAIMRFDCLSTDRPTIAEGELNVFELNRNRIYGLYGDRPGDLAHLIAHIDLSRRVRGTEFEYWHIRDLDLVPPVNDIACYVPAGPRDVSYDVAVAITDVDDIPFVHESLFLKWIEAECRMMLAGMRGKYGGVLPGATGDLQTDAADQRAIAERLFTEAEGELKKLEKAAPPITA